MEHVQNPNSFALLRAQGNEHLNAYVEHRGFNEKTATDLKSNILLQLVWTPNVEKHLCKGKPTPREIARKAVLIASIEHHNGKAGLLLQVLEQFLCDTNIIQQLGLDELLAVTEQALRSNKYLLPVAAWLACGCSAGLWLWQAQLSLARPLLPGVDSITWRRRL